MKIKNTLNLSGILFLMATSFLYAIPSKYKIVNNTIVLKEPRYFIDIGVGGTFFPDIKYQLKAKRVQSVYDSENVIIPGYPKETPLENISSLLRSKNKISFSPVAEIGIIDEELYYSIKVALSNEKWLSTLLHEDIRQEEYSLLGASFLVSVNYKFYSYKRFGFFMGPTAGVSLGAYKWNYNVTYKQSDILSQPKDGETVSKKGRYQNYLFGLNLGLEYKFNRSFAIYLENSLLFSNMNNKDNRSTSERQNQTSGGYVIKERIDEVALGVNYQNNTRIKLRYYF